MKKLRMLIGYFLYIFIGQWLPHYQLGYCWKIPKKFRQLCGKLLLLNCGQNVDIGRHVKFSFRTTLGDNSSIGDNTFIQGNVKIGKNVMIGPQCMFIAENHSCDDVDILINKQPKKEKGIIIEDNVWIAARVIILDGVKISEGTVIGAGSVVSNDTINNSIVVGAKARKIRKRGER